MGVSFGVDDRFKQQFEAMAIRTGIAPAIPTRMRTSGAPDDHKTIRVLVTSVRQPTQGGFQYTANSFAQFIGTQISDSTVSAGGGLRLTFDGSIADANKKDTNTEFTVDDLYGVSADDFDWEEPDNQDFLDKYENQEFYATRTPILLSSEVGAELEEVWAILPKVTSSDDGNNSRAFVEVTTVESASAYIVNVLDGVNGNVLIEGAAGAVLGGIRNGFSVGYSNFADVLTDSEGISTYYLDGNILQ